MKPVRLCLLVLLFAVNPVAAQPSDAPPQWPTFTRLFDAYAGAAGLVGGSALVVRDGRVVARHHYGFADRAAGRPVDDRTLFHYGSITKTLTGIAVMQLRDRGLLALDDPATRWIPELRRIHNPYGAMDSVTVRMLLAHTSGLQNPTWPWTRGAAWEPFEPTTWEQLVAMMPYQQLRFEPGTRYSYSNPAFIYLARIVEAITGDAWQAYVQKNLFAPLGLSRSYFGTTPYHLAADRSHNYYVQSGDDGQATVVDNGTDFDPGITIPNGGWNAPLDDLAAYLAFLTGATPNDFVLSQQTLREMWTPQADVPEDPSRLHRMGLSFFFDEIGGRTVVGHAGSQAGFRAYLYFDPARRTGVAFVFNTASDDLTPAAQQTFDEMLESALRLLD